MSKTDEYRQLANDCIVWARIATSDDQREEERQLRKRRLIKGPQEFRDIRSNRAKIKLGFPRMTPELG